VLGGVREFVNYEFGQAAYVAAADATISRSGFSKGELLATFLTHPFGPKWIALPLLLLAGIGLFSNRIPRRHLSAIVVLIAAHSLFTLWTSDPADAVRYMMLPVVAWALLAAAGAEFVATRLHVKAVSLLLALTFLGVSIWYCAPILRNRLASPSPTVQAAIWVNRNIDPHALILYPASMRPHSELLFRRYQILPIERGMALAAATPQRAVYRLTDGPTRKGAVASFSWGDSDAYRKLTRKHYRVVSVVPIPERERFTSIYGIDALESDRRGEEWRWLRAKARLQLPPIAAKNVVLELALSPRAAIESNSVTVLIDGIAAAQVVVERGSSVKLTLPLRRPSALIDFEATTTFQPNRTRRLRNRDPRILAVQLRSLTVE
jgi:hypothetical protein